MSSLENQERDRDLSTHSLDREANIFQFSKLSIVTDDEVASVQQNSLASIRVSFAVHICNRVLNLALLSAGLLTLLAKVRFGTVQNLVDLGQQ